MEWLSGDWPKVVISAVVPFVAYLSYRLSKRGQHAQQAEQQAANEFSRMSELNDRLVVENARLAAANERKASAIREWGPRWHTQLLRCRDSTDALLAIVAKATDEAVARKARRDVEDHRSSDHLEMDESGE